MQHAALLDEDKAVGLAGPEGNLAAAAAEATHLEYLWQAHLGLGAEPAGK